MEIGRGVEHLQQTSGQKNKFGLFVEYILLNAGRYQGASLGADQIKAATEVIGVFPQGHQVCVEVADGVDIGRKR